jgi:hypothetical protein
MKIQSTPQNMPSRPLAAAMEEDDEDPWAGYQDTLEIESSPALAAGPCLPPVDDFAQAQARLAQRSQVLDQKNQWEMQRRSIQPQTFAHLNSQGINRRAGLTDSAPPQPMTLPVGPRPPVNARLPAPSPLPVEPDPAHPEFPSQDNPLPYEIDAWGNPILPEYAELDVYGNIYWNYN